MAVHDLAAVRRAGAAALAALVLAACSRSGGAGAGGALSRANGARPHVLRIGDIQDLPGGLNPALYSGGSLGSIAELTLAWMVRYDRHNRPYADLAREVPTQANGGVSRDGRTITWHLRPGLRWSDGAPITSADLAFTVAAMNNPANNVLGRDGWDRIARTETPDPLTLVMRLRRPYASYLPTFFASGGNNPCILPKHLLGALATINQAPFNSVPIGAGPFKVTEWQRGDHVTMVPNPYWHGPKPKLSEIVYRFIPDRNTLLNQLKAGEVDLWPRVSAGFYPQVASIPGVAVFRQPGYYFAHLDFNNDRPMFRDKRVREALRLAIDRRTIQQKSNHGTGLLSETMITPASPYHRDLPLVPFDLGRANRLLDDAGWVRGADGIRAKNGVRLALDFATTTGSPDADQLIELVRSTWQQVGAAFTVHRYPTATFFGTYASGGIMYAGKWDVIQFVWQVTPDGNTSNLYDPRQIPPAGQNDERYRNAAIEPIYEQLDAAYDESRRTPLITASVRRVIEDVPTVVLYIRDDIHAYNRALTGWHPNVSTPFDDFTGVDIE